MRFSPRRVTWLRPCSKTPKTAQPRGGRKRGAGATVSNIAANSVSPQEPPYGTGNILDFHAGSANDVFTYIGSGFPDTTDTYVSFEHMEAPGAGFVFDVSMVTAQGLVTDIQVTSAAAGPATLAGTVITLPIGPGTTIWRTTLLNLPSQISNLDRRHAGQDHRLQAYADGGEHRPLLR